MRTDLLPYYLQNLKIRGFEETDAEKAAREAKEAEESEEDEDDEEEDDPAKGKDSKDGDGKDKNTDNLKSALQKERQARKKLERESRADKKRLKEIDDAAKSDADKAKDDAAEANSKAQRLAVRLRDTAVDNVVIKLAATLKFRDPDDALKLIDRDLIEVEQDEDDPAEVEVDEDSVKKALEKLAKKKTHLIVAEGQGEKSGSKFSGGRKSQEEIDEDEMRRRYPALNRSNRQGASSTP